MAASPKALDETERREAVSALPWVFLSLLGVAAAITLVFLTMRVVMSIGGSCASGGPYVNARPCPSTVWLMPVGIVGGLILAFVYILKKPARAPSFASLFWPALFLSLGWNFLEFGLWPPGGQGLEWGWLICAFVFALMGGAPLLAALLSEPRIYLRRVFWGAIEPLISPPGLETEREPIPERFRKPPPPPPRPKSERPPPTPVDVAAQLERLDKLHKAGSLTDAEFEAAKKRVLEKGQ